MEHRVTCDLAGRELTLEVGKLAKQADAAVMVTLGETAAVAGLLPGVVCYHIGGPEKWRELESLQLA